MDMEMMGGRMRPSGSVDVARTRKLGDLSTRRAPLAWRARNWLENRRRSVGQVAAARCTGRLFGFAPILTTLSGHVYRANFAALSPEQALKLKVLLQARVDLSAAQIGQMLDELGGYVDVRQLPRFFGGEVIEYGLLSRRLVTNNGVNYLVDALQNLVEPENLKFHGFGTGTNAEAQADSALQTEFTTEYATDNTRPTGSLTEGASANIFRTVATFSPDSGGTLAVTEHGVLSQAATGGGTLLDRSKFSAVNLVAGSDSLQATYDLTVAAGG